MSASVFSGFFLDQPDFELLLGIFGFTLVVALFALINLLRFFGVWWRYRDFVAIVLIGFSFLTLIDELWSLLTQWMQMTHTDIDFLVHLSSLRWLRLIERGIAVIMLMLFVVWNAKKNG